MMKRVYLLFAVVAAQLLWLGWNYADRTREMAEAPVIYWKKEADGLHRVCRVETPGSAQDSPAAGETRALMWGDIVSDFDIEKEGEKIILVKQMAKLRLSFSRNHWGRMRFYVEEGTGDIRRLWLNEIEEKDNVPFDKVRRTVDIVLRENAAAIPRMLYLNGVPYPEAIDQMRNKTFKWENSAE